MLFLKRMRTAAVLVALFTTSCVSQKATTDIGSEYQKANQAATSAVHDAETAGRSTRRMASVIAYINTQEPDAGDNLDAKAPVDSFANFVCTGADDLV